MSAFFLLINLDKSRRHGVLLRLAWRFEAVLLEIFWRLFAALSPDAASALGRRVLRLLGPRLRKSRKLTRNLALVRPNATDAELDALMRETWGSYGALLAEFPHLERIGAEADERMEILGVENLEKTIGQGRPAIFALAHLGNWNVAALLAKRAGLDLTVVESPRRNPLLQSIFERAQRMLGCTFIDKARGPREVLRQLQAGRSVAILADVRIDPGEMVPLFGTEVSTTVIPARLALRTGCDLVPVRTQRTRGCRFAIEIEPPIRPDDPDASVREQALQMTRKLNERYEAWIDAAPTQWLCFKRRGTKATRTRSGAKILPPPPEAPRLTAGPAGA